MKYCEILFVDESFSDILVKLYQNTESVRKLFNDDRHTECNWITIFGFGTWEIGFQFSISHTNKITFFFVYITVESVNLMYMSW